jgi:membrane protein
VGGTVFKSAIRHARASVQRFSRAVWGRDLEGLRGWRALGIRVARVVTWSVRGFFTNKISLQSAALAYYTIFSIVPVLVVALWVLKLFDAIPHLTAPLPTPSSVTAPQAAEPTTATLLRQAVRAILGAVQQKGRLEIGIAGVVALAYGVIKQVVHMEKALDTIADARQRPPRYPRMLGYLALLVLPPALLVVSGVLRILSRLPGGTTLTKVLSVVLNAAPVLKSALSTVIGLAIVCAALSILYSSAARARIAWPSTIVGALVGAVLLAGVLWAFARLQVGASRAGALESGIAVIPVFLLWSFSSWVVILIGAQVAVAHELNRILLHGVRALTMDPYDEQLAGVQIMVESTRRTLSLAGTGLTTNELARQLRLLPGGVRRVAGRLRAAGLLRQSGADRYWLACDPDRTHLRDVVGAAIGHLGAEHISVVERTGPTLREMAERV